MATETTYRCEHCGGVFDQTEEMQESAIAERDALWGGDFAPDEMVKICDGCFQRFMQWYRERVPD